MQNHQAETISTICKIFVAENFYLQDPFGDGNIHQEKSSAEQYHGAGGACQVRHKLIQSQPRGQCCTSICRTSPREKEHCHSHTQCARSLSQTAVSVEAVHCEAITATQHGSSSHAEGSTVTVDAVSRQAQTVPEQANCRVGQIFKQHVAGTVMRIRSPFSITE